MTTILQLDPPLHVWIPEKDDFMLVWFLIDYHMEEHLYYSGPMQKTGEIWTLDTTKVRATNNPTIGRILPKT